MKKLALFFVMAIMFSSFTLCAAADPDIDDFYAIPNNPYEGTNFDIYVRAEDDDGIEKIKLYVDGSLEETEDCDDDDRCSVYFDVYEDSPGYHVYKVKVYDVDSNTETDDIEVYVRPRSYPYYPVYNDEPQITASSSPVQPQVGQGFSIQTSVIDSDGVKKIEAWHGNTLVGSQYCGGMTSCSKTFPISPKYTPSTYTFQVKAYDEVGLISTRTLTIPIMQGSVCGDGVCQSGETCSICAQDCGQCNYCGDGKCSSGETCSSCTKDCGACPSKVLPTVIYTCEQKGGECCEDGGKGAIGGASDCPSKCYNHCDEPEPEEDEETGAPTGAVIMGDSSVAMIALVVIVLLLSFYTATKVKSL